jgi:hypothetical protein
MPAGPRITPKSFLRTYTPHTTNSITFKVSVGNAHSVTFLEHIILGVVALYTYTSPANHNTSRNPNPVPTMASVTSLDQDMRKLRLDRYTPKAANEVRTWIEDVLGERLPVGDLLDALKDGTVLCR